MGLEFDLALTWADRRFFKKVESFYPSSRKADDKYLWEVRHLLQDMGIVDAKISYLKNKNGRVIRGSHRLPLLVETSGKKLVVKDYDDYDSLTERTILEKVSGRLAPEVLHFGSNLYAELYLDLQRFISLHDLSDVQDPYSDELTQTICTGVAMHAELAKLRINYHHVHWLDEFYIGTCSDNQSARMIIDFGTSKLFFNQDIFSDYEEFISSVPCGVGDYETFNDLFGVKRCTEIFQGIRDKKNKYLEFFLTDNDSKDEQVKALLDMDLVIAANVLYVLEYLEEGLKSYFKTGNEQHPSNPIPVLKPAYTKAFFDCYLN